MDLFIWTLTGTNHIQDGRHISVKADISTW